MGAKESRASILSFDEASKRGIISFIYLLFVHHLDLNCLV